MAPSRAKRGPLRVEVPRPEDEKLRFGRVGIIAVVGFVLGMLWPRLAGVKLVPSAPAIDEQTEQGAEQAAASAASAAPSAPPPAVKPQAVEPPPPKPEPADRLKVSDPQVTSCRDHEGKRLRECDKLDIDGVARSRVLALSACPAAADVRGTLSLGLELDFGTKKIKGVFKGKSTTLDADKADALLECAKPSFESASLDGIEHKAPAYTVFYRVDFMAAPAAAPEGPATEDAGTETTLASGRATVIWEVAILRSTPTKDGEVVARLLRGTRLVVTGRQGDWYKVKYNSKNDEGWVFRTAVGL